MALEGVLNFRDLAEACEGVVAPGRVYRTATVGKATVDDAGRILDDLRVTRLLDLRSADEFEDEPGPVQSAFELRAFERLSSNVNDADDGFWFDLVVADDARQLRKVEPTARCRRGRALRDATDGVFRLAVDRAEPTSASRLHRR